MREYAEVTSQITERKVIRVVCDLCGEEIPKHPSNFHHREFTLEFAQGMVFPEGGTMRGWRVEDACDECVEELRIVLSEMGWRVTPTEADY